jgi:hypothetical protein
MGAGISAYPIRASLLKRNSRPGLAIIITLEAAQLELQKTESMTTSIPLEPCGADGIACCSQAPKGIRRNEPHGPPGRQQ